jgi:hypothetical protein
LVGVEGYQSFATGGSSALAVGPTIRRLVAKINPRTLIEHRDTTTTTGCEPGTGGGATDTTVTTDSATEENLTLQTYYDTACADLESTLTWTATLSSTASGYTITGPATFSEYADGSTTADESATAGAGTRPVFLFCSRASPRTALRSVHSASPVPSRHRPEHRRRAESRS